MRPIRYRFDPAASGTSSGRARLPAFSFLEEALSAPVDGLENCNVFDPRGIDVPWPTAFPATAQSKHWKASEAAATEIIDQILAANPTETGALPEDLSDTAYKNEKIFAKAALLLFMHDDVIESQMNQDFTIIDQATSIMTNPDSQETLLVKNPIFEDFCQEVLKENAETGRKLIDGILHWVKHTRDYVPGKVGFISFPDYIEYRIKDFAVHFCDAAIMMSAGINMTEEEMEPLRHIHYLYITHFALTNDLYSYGKEIKANREKGTAVVNAAQALAELLSISPLLGKLMLRAILWDFEAKINSEQERLVQNGGLKGNQLRFMRGMFVTLAGNVFYSATTGRYATAAIEASHM